MKKKSQPRCTGGPRQRGGAAVEAALVLPILVTLMSFPVFYARCFWHYTAAQKAVQNAARYLSSVPSAEMRSSDLAAAAGATAIQIASRGIAELAPGSRIAAPTAYCDNLLCGSGTPGTLPATVKVHVSFSMFDTFLGVVDNGRYGIPITAEVTMNYAGN